MDLVGKARFFHESLRDYTRKFTRDFGGRSGYEKSIHELIEGMYQAARSDAFSLAFQKRMVDLLELFT